MVVVPRRVVIAIVLLTVLPVQAAVFGRLGLPGPAPDLVLVAVVAIALAEGPLGGLVTGFAAGLLADVVPPADHTVGRLALAYCLAGYVAGLVADEVSRSAFLPMAVVAVSTAVAGSAYAIVGAVLGDGRVTWGSFARGVPLLVVYDVVLTPFVVPAVMSLLRRAQPSGSLR